MIWSTSLRCSGAASILGTASTSSRTSVGWTTKTATITPPKMVDGGLERSAAHYERGRPARSVEFDESAQCATQRGREDALGLGLCDGNAPWATPYAMGQAPNGRVRRFCLCLGRDRADFGGSDARSDCAAFARRGEDDGDGDGEQCD